jgi:electron transport complex protein RnfG
MKEMLRYGFILALICAISGGLLAGVNMLTKPKIAQQKANEEKAALEEVMPQADRFELMKGEGKPDYYKAFDKSGTFLGVVFKSSAKGYSSTIEVLTGMLKSGKIVAIKVLSQNETPGLGSQVSDNKFTGQFSGKDSALSDVQAITGATISSRAVINSVKEKAKEIKTLIANEK